MKHWRIVFRSTSDQGVAPDSRPIKRDIGTVMRVSETYEVQCLGISLLGFDFRAEDHEFNHIMRLLKILESRYLLSIIKLSEIENKEIPRLAVKIGSSPATKVA